MRIRAIALGLCAPLLLAAAGCQSEDRFSSLPDLVPVSGTVTLDGEPLSGASLMFLPVGATKGQTCYGATDASGRYELMVSKEHVGAPVGEFEVVVNKWVMPDGSDFPKDATVPPGEAGAKELLPPHYTTEGMSKLKATVPAGGGEINFDLSLKNG